MNILENILSLRRAKLSSHKIIIFINVHDTHANCRKFGNIKTYNDF